MAFPVTVANKLKLISIVHGKGSLSGHPVQLKIVRR